MSNKGGRDTVLSGSPGRAGWDPHAATVTDNFLSNQNRAFENYPDAYSPGQVNESTRNPLQDGQTPSAYVF